MVELTLTGGSLAEIDRPLPDLKGRYSNWVFAIERQYCAAQKFDHQQLIGVGQIDAGLWIRSPQQVSGLVLLFFELDYRLIATLTAPL